MRIEKPARRSSLKRSSRNSKHSMQNGKASSNYSGNISWRRSGISRNESFGACRRRLFFNRDYMIGLHIFERLFASTRPQDFNFANLGGLRPEAEMDASVACGGVAHAGRCMTPLRPSVASNNLDAGADTHAVAFCAAQFQFEPMILVLCQIAENRSEE